MADHLEISRQALFKHLSKLLKQDKIYKIGKPPKVFYSIKNSKPPLPDNYIVKKRIKDIINKRFFIITPLGEQKIGWHGFIYWCQKNNLAVEKTADEYIKTLKKYDVFRKQGLINGLEKIKNTFEKIHLNKIYYLDFYSIKRFGKTKLGQLLLYAKQSQNKDLIKILSAKIKPQIIKLIKQEKIDAVGSGDSLNETAKQIKNKKVAKKVVGLSITGSFKGFDVISEV